MGKETVLQLARHRPSRIFLAARTPSKGEAAVEEVKSAVPTADVTFLKLDLCSFESISAAAQEFKSQSSRLDVLINNAGIMATPGETSTEEGFESQFGTNHIGHSLLTKQLLPTLLSTAKEEGADVRIVNLTSEGHNLAPSKGIVFDDIKLKEYGPWARYGQSKLANILFTKELARRYPEITSVAIHPGLVLTDLYGPNQQTSMLLRYGLKIVGPLIMADVPTGAKNQLWAATAKKSEVNSGSYYTPIGRQSGGSKLAQKSDLARELWDWTDREISRLGH